MLQQEQRKTIKLQSISSIFIITAVAIIFVQETADHLRRHLVIVALLVSVMFTIDQSHEVEYMNNDV